MTISDLQKLEIIVGRIETLQGKTRDPNAKSRLGAAKDELIRLLNENK